MAEDDKSGEDGSENGEPEQLRLMKRLVELSEYRTHLSELRTEMSADRSRMSADRSRMSADRSRMSADRSRMSADRSLMSTERSEMSADRSRMSADRSFMSSDRSRMSADRSIMSTDRSRMSAERSIMSADRSRMSADRSLMSADRSEMSEDRSYMNAERTLSVWTRTALALMVFGIALDRFALLLNQHPAWAGNLPPQSFAALAGAALVAFGILMALASGLRYLAYSMRWLRLHRPMTFHGPYLAFVFSMLTAAFGVALLVFMLVFS